MTSWGSTATRIAVLLVCLVAVSAPASDVQAGTDDSVAPYRYPAAFFCTGDGGHGANETLVVAANPGSVDLVVDVIVRGDRTTISSRTLGAGERISVACADLPDGSGSGGFVDLRSPEPLDVVATYQTTVRRGADPTASAVAGITVVVQLERQAENDAERAAFAALGLEPWVPKTLLVLTEAPAEGLLVPVEAATRGLEARLADVLAQSGMGSEEAEHESRRIVTEAMRCWVELGETDIAQGGSGPADIAVSIDVVSVEAAPRPAAPTDDDRGESTVSGTTAHTGDSGQPTTSDGGTSGDGSQPNGEPGSTEVDGASPADPAATAFSGAVVIEDETGWLAVWLILLLLLLLLLVLAIVAVGFWLTRRRRHDEHPNEPPPDEPPPVPIPTPPPAPAPPSAAYDISCAFDGERHIDVDDRAATLRITAILQSPEHVVQGAADGRLVLSFDFTGQRLTFQGQAAGELAFALPDHVTGEPIIQEITVTSGAFSSTDLDAPSADTGTYEFAGTVSSRPDPPVSGLDSIETTSTLRFVVAHD